MIHAHSMDAVLPYALHTCLGFYRTFLPPTTHTPPGCSAGSTVRFTGSLFLPPLLHHRYFIHTPTCLLYAFACLPPPPAAYLCRFRAKFATCLSCCIFLIRLTTHYAFLLFACCIYTAALPRLLHAPAGLIIHARTAGCLQFTSFSTPAPPRAPPPLPVDVRKRNTLPHFLPLHTHCTPAAAHHRPRCAVYIPGSTCCHLPPPPATVVRSLPRSGLPLYRCFTCTTRPAAAYVLPLPAFITFCAHAPRAFVRWLAAPCSLRFLYLRTLRTGFVPGSATS